MDEDAGASTPSGSEGRKVDPRLDFFSDKFDPILALKTTDLQVPDADAKKYDNLSKYRSAMEKEKNPEKFRQNPKKKAEAPEEIVRRWLPHQLPIKTAGRVKPKKNIFVKMETIKGPLAFLKKCRDERLRIKIWTRNQKGVRGYCLAYLIAFDKHWNMALEDVYECWTRPKKRKVPALDSVEENEESRYRIRPPKIQVTPHKTDKKLENCTRRVLQLMMRGEHVVLVHVSNEGEDPDEKG